MMEKPRFLAVLTVLFWSFSSMLARMLSLSAPYFLFCISFAVALVIYLIYARCIYKKELFKRLRQIPAKYYFIGLLGYYAIWIGNTESFQSYDSASETTVLNYTWLIFTVFFSELIFNRPGRYTKKTALSYLGIIFCFASVYLLAVEGNLHLFDFQNTEGLLWGLGGGISYGLFSAYSSKIPKNKHPLFLIAAVSSSLIAMIFTTILQDASTAGIIYEISPKDIMAAIGLGVLVDALGYIMWTRSLREAKKKGMNISKIASVIFVLPVISLIIVSISFGENLLLRNYFIGSLALLLAGIILSQYPGLFTGRISKF